jgi:short-subunit dehydrogenase
MIRHVLPVMRRQGWGKIIFISSVAGMISIPYQSMYSASKYALEALVEALGMRLPPSVSKLAW